MRTIKIWLTIGYPGADRKWEVEIEDNMTRSPKRRATAPTDLLQLMECDR